MEEKDNNKVIKAYKSFNKDMTCRGFQYEVGKEYETNDAVLCEKGFHACENPLDVLDFYSDVDDKYCVVEQSGKTETDGKKTVSSRIKIIAEVGFVGLLKLGIEWLKEITSPKKVDNKDDGDYAQIGSSGDSAQIGSSDNYAQIGSSGNYAKIGSLGTYAKIGSSGNSAQINSEGEESVICCAGHNSIVKAKKGSWITLSEWKYDDKKNRYVPVCVKTERVDGEHIKEDVFYKLVNGEFVEVE